MWCKFKVEQGIRNSRIWNLLLFFVVCALWGRVDVVDGAELQRFNRTVFPSARYGHVAIPLRLTTALPLLTVNTIGGSSNNELLNESSKTQAKDWMVVDGGWPWDGSLSDNQAYAFDLPTRQWFTLTVGGTKPSLRHYHASAVAPHRSFAVVSGGFRSGALEDVYLLVANTEDVGGEAPTVSMSWFPVRARFECQPLQVGECLMGPRYGHSSVMVARGEGVWDVVVFGGRSMDGSARNDVRVLRVTQQGPRRDDEATWDFVWLRVPEAASVDAPSPRSLHGAAVVGGALFM